jgi:hypothetical protein
VLRDVAEAALGWEASVIDAVDSGLPGPKGNREFFLYLAAGEGAAEIDDARIAAAVG